MGGLSGAPWLVFGGVYGLLGVGLGAFGAHALRDRLDPALLAVFRTGVDYQMWHALALLAVGLLAGRVTGAWLHAAGAAFALGVLLFSGSLYVLALAGLRGFGMVTPLGGLAFIIGWICLIVAVLRAPPFAAAG